MKYLTDNQRNALFRLMADADERVLDLIDDALQGFDDRAEDLLREALRRADPDSSSQLRARLSTHTGPEAEQRLREVVADTGFDLEQAAFALAGVEYPDLDASTYSARFDEFAERLRRRGVRPDDAGHAIAALNRLLLVEEGFGGDDDVFEDPECSYLNRVIDTRRGLPISLCTVYMSVARRIGLPLCGVGMPAHFLVRFQGPDGELFIDVFHRGRLLTRRDCAELLGRYGISYAPEHLAPSDPREIFRRMAMNLFLLYRRMEDEGRRERMRRILGILRQGAVRGETR